jgi:hypothetical protein
VIATDQSLIVLGWAESLQRTYSVATQLMVAVASSKAAAAPKA